MTNMNRMTRGLSWIMIFSITFLLAACQQENEDTLTPSNTSELPLLSIENAATMARTAAPRNSILGYYGAEWWKWAYSFPCASSPILDTTGAFQNQKQPERFFFIAGTGTGIRKITIPYGKIIFYPVVAYINDYPCPDPTFQPAPGQSMGDFLAEGAKFYMDSVDSLAVELDGYSFPNLYRQRATSSLFYFTGNPDGVNCLDACITAKPQPAVTDGYWMMLAPLSRGKHTLHTRARIAAVNYFVDLTYDITIE